MNLDHLLTFLEQKEKIGTINPFISGITQDSRQIRPGFIFVCIRGYQLDGHDYLEEAVKKGAVAVVVDRDLSANMHDLFRNGNGMGVALIRVKDSREALALLSAAFYQHPSHKMRVIGVTGTKGKTTTTYLIASVLEAAGFCVGLTNTLTSRIRGEEIPSVRTTPESVDLQKTLADMVDAGCQYAVVEVSSHSLVLHRVLGCEFDVGVLTNVTSDHLDFHGSVDEYQKAKEKLFSGLGRGEKSPKMAVLNLDDSSFSMMAIAVQKSFGRLEAGPTGGTGILPVGKTFPDSYKSTDVGIVSYGIHQNADIKAENVTFTPQGMEFEVQNNSGERKGTKAQGNRGTKAQRNKDTKAQRHRGTENKAGFPDEKREKESAENNHCSEKIKINSSLSGMYNVSNILAAMSVGVAEGISFEAIKKGIEKIAHVPGRFEMINCGQDFWVIVDFAHTTDALAHVLEAGRQLKPHRLITVFGCGGDRDRTKRFPMGRVAAGLSDYLIITNDNARSEDPVSIAKQIEEGVIQWQKEKKQMGLSFQPDDKTYLGASARGITGYEIILDRYQAIEKAISMAKTGDMVVIAGKGHEQYQIIGSSSLPFDDREVARRILTGSVMKSSGSISSENTPHLKPSLTREREQDFHCPLCRHAGMSVLSIISATKGELVYGDQGASFSGISIDSRTIKTGELFWSLKGVRFDGHQFISDALAKGAQGAIVDQDFSVPSSWPCDRILIRVDDCLSALQKTAKYLRERFNGKVVALTGSNGKTTTKEMIASILSGFLGQGKVLKTEGNYNNLIGLPLTLCRLSSGIEAIVLELGMSAFGEIRRLTQISQPEIGLITNIGPAHIEFFGSLKEISKAKGELFEEMKSDSLAVVNLDDPYIRALDKGSKKVITFGFSEKADVRAKDMRQGEEGIDFILCIGGKSIEVHLPLIGQHNVYNALAASSVALSLDVPLSFIQQGLAKVSLPPMRMMRIESKHGFTIINDAYNANPVSMRSAIETVLALERGGRIFLVLGDMLELGQSTERFHREIGCLIGHKSIDFLFTYGQFAQWIGEEALNQGMSEERVFSNPDHSEIAQQLKKRLSMGDIVLVKGSRGAGMEKVINLMMNEE